MIAFLRIAVLVLAVSVFVGCSENSDSAGSSGGETSASAPKTPDPGTDVVSSPCEPCFVSQENSISIFKETQELWTRAFMTRFERLDPPYRYVAIPADTLEEYVNTPLDPNNPNDTVAGLKAYFALQHTAYTDDETFDELCLILVPYSHGTNDTIIDRDFPFQDGPYVRLIPDSTPANISHLQYAPAQNLIQNWAAHYDTIEHTSMIRVSSFVITKESLTTQIEIAGSSGYDSNVYFMFGLHTLDPSDTVYCPQNAPAYDPAYAGFPVYNLILSTMTNGGKVEHSSDFLRPCPRYCGKPKFTSVF